MILAVENIDHSIIELSRNPPHAILTENKVFGEWVFVHHIKGISVIHLHGWCITGSP
jgi:hypothetical protein